MNKGFTLIEVIVVICLLGLVAIVIATNMVSLNGKQNSKEYKDYVNKVESAACTYYEKKEYEEQRNLCKENNKSETCKIKIDLLLNKGFISEDLRNPKEDKKVTELKDQFVLISYKDGEKICKLQEGK